jgi:hypothetical protein
MPGLFALLLLLAFAAIPLLIVLLVIWLTKREQAPMTGTVPITPVSPGTSSAAVLFFAGALATLLIVPRLLVEVASGRIEWPVRALGRVIEVTAAKQPLAFAASAVLYVAVCGLCLRTCSKSLCTVECEKLWG